MDYTRRRFIQRNRREHEQQFEPFRNVQPAVVFARNGSIYVPGQPGMVWVHQLGVASSHKAVLRGRAPAVDGLWVWIGEAPKPPYRWQILDTYTAELSTAGLVAVTRTTLPLHAQNHTWASEETPGIDRLPIYQPALQMLKCTGNGDLTVTVNGLIWGDGNRFLGDGAFDLSSYVPVSGTVPVLVYLDTDTNALDAVVGSYTAGGDIYSPDTIVFPGAPLTAINSAYVLLSPGQTVIAETDPEDARDLLNRVGGNPDELGDLTDVTLDTPGDGELLVYDSGDWINQTAAEAGLAAATHTHVEADITDLDHDAVKLQGRDVAADAPADGDVLAWDDGASEWAPVPASAGASALDDLTDVNATSPADGQALIWDDGASEWVPGDVAGSGSSGGNPAWDVDGALAVATELGAYICTSAGEIEAVYIYCRDPGASGSTIIDVNLNGTTIFTTQANRPELAYDDADSVAKSGAPDVTTVAEYDVLTWDIDQVAAGAADLTVVIVMAMSGGAIAGDRIVDGDSSVEVDDTGTGAVDVTIDAATIATFGPFGLLLAGAMRLGVVVDSATGAYVIDHDAANVFDITLTGDTTFSMDNAPAAGISGSFLLVLHPEGHAAFMPGEWVWTGASAITPTAGTATIISGFTVDGGTTYYVTRVATGVA